MKNNNNKKKVLPLLLALLLLISAGAYGTRAFFTDQEELKTSINIESGKLSIKSDKDAQWQYVPLADETIDKAYIVNTKLKVSADSMTAGVEIDGLKVYDFIGSKAYISNARPGDAFTRAFTFTNDGSLDLRISLISKLPDVAPNGFTVTFTDGNEGEILENGESVTYNLTISVNSELTAGTDLGKYSLNYLEENLIVKVTQPNAN
ncbi:MAG: hypothetical protein WBI17_05965 [Clostridiaceae bacterium]